MFFRFYFLQMLHILFSSKRKKRDITETFIICKFPIFLDSLGIILQCKKSSKEAFITKQFQKQIKSANHKFKIIITISDYSCIFAFLPCNNIPKRSNQNRNGYITPEIGVL